MASGFINIVLLVVLVVTSPIFQITLLARLLMLAASHTEDRQLPQDAALAAHHRSLIVLVVHNFASAARDSALYPDFFSLVKPFPALTEGGSSYTPYTSLNLVFR